MNSTDADWQWEAVHVYMHGHVYTCVHARVHVHNRYLQSLVGTIHRVRVDASTLGTLHSGFCLRSRQSRESFKQRVARLTKPSIRKCILLDWRGKIINRGVPIR